AVLGTVLRGGGGEWYDAQSCTLPVVEHPRRTRVEGQLEPAVGGVDRLPAGTGRLREPFLQLGLGDHQATGHARSRADHEVHQRALHSIAGQVSMTIRTPAWRVRRIASSSITPSWNHTALAPTFTAWSANSPAASERRKTSTTSIGNGTSARVAKPCSPSTTRPSSESAAGWMGTICLPRSWSSAAMEYAVRLVSPESPTTAQTLQSSSMN